MDAEKRTKLLTDLSNTRKALGKKPKQYRLQQLGQVDTLAALQSLQVTSEEPSEQWEELKHFPKAKKEKGTLAFIEERDEKRFYESGGKMFSVDSQLVLKNNEGKSLQLNDALIELFFKQKPDETKYSVDDVKTYRKFLTDSGLNLNLSTKKQKKLSQSSTATIIVPPSTEEQLERVNILLAAWREGHNDVFDELNAIMSTLYENGEISKEEYENILKENGEPDS